MDRTLTREQRLRRLHATAVLQAGGLPPLAAIRAARGLSEVDLAAMWSRRPAESEAVRDRRRELLALFEADLPGNAAAVVPARRRGRRRRGRNYPTAGKIFKNPGI